MREAQSNCIIIISFLSLCLPLGFLTMLNGLIQRPVPNAQKVASRLERDCVNSVDQLHAEQYLSSTTTEDGNSMQPSETAQVQAILAVENLSDRKRPNPRLKHCTQSNLRSCSRIGLATRRARRDYSLQPLIKSQRTRQMPIT